MRQPFVSTIDEISCDPTIDDAKRMTIAFLAFLTNRNIHHSFFHGMYQCIMSVEDLKFRTNVSDMTRKK